MAQKDPLIAELKNEAVNTRKMLERIPEDKYSWKPHDKSMTIGRLASHIAELPVWVNRVLQADEFDFATATTLRNTYEGTAALLKVFEDRQSDAINALQNASDEMMHETFSVLRGGNIVFTLPRKVMMRNFAFNHLIHHRGQLSVFLRILDVPVPGMYGPSADEK
jgi:uncharacterized damage-inducible protein DinB